MTFFFLRELGKKAGHVPNTINPQESFNMFSWFVFFFLPLFMNFLIPLHETLMGSKQVFLREQDVPILPAY